jgi:hypothetical protein
VREEKDRKDGEKVEEKIEKKQEENKEMMLGKKG